MSEAQRLGADPYFHRALPLDELSAHALQASAHRACATECPRRGRGRGGEEPAHGRVGMAGSAASSGAWAGAMAGDAGHDDVRR